MKKFILLFIFISFCYSQSSITYLVYLNKLPNTTNKIDFPVKNILTGYENIIDKGIKDIKIASGQPFRLTQYLIAPNTNYALVSIAYKDDIEKSWFDNLENLGIILKISESNTVTKQTRFGNEIIMEQREYNSLPDDFSKNWEIRISTK